MSEQQCDECGSAFRPRQHNQRFCCRACSDDWHSDERRRGIDILRNRHEWTGQDLLDSIETGDPEAIWAGWRLVRQVLEAIGKEIDRGALPVSQVFCLARDFHEFERRSVSYAEWREDWRARNPEQAAEDDALRQRVSEKLRAKARDGSLVRWCSRHRLNPIAVADFAWGGDGRPKPRN